MRFNPKARLDTGRMRDGGGGGGGLGGGMGGGGMRIPIPTGRGGRSGCLTLVLVLVAVVVAMCGGPNLLGPILGGSGGGGTALGGYSASRMGDAQDGGDRYADCKTGEDANNSADCARVAVENSLTDFWSKQDVPD